MTALSLALSQPTATTAPLTAVTSVSPIVSRPPGAPSYHREPLRAEPSPEAAHRQLGAAHLKTGRHGVITIEYLVLHDIEAFSARSHTP
ncbi:hypothetical protein [Jonesia denitrificans]|uniref:Uncharacterized protein n=1 Tax=Jonesia denitrificans (strain ATCC 14870 / DSM 20603 / BCRC 15368 / CIP 55.134 / JCM 11481 / NBRC 15587 / NCTC 10816 / Prevot 55134) TaxID=471856 RepID=C7R303_JONDD|nr:hypothetical protein [Jonesia denitrificans]ACV08625.1 hypothetical protein Jden_0969 [Jonesia denitrificans DSM 20603]QXB42374.1 hypothetical protein I6L70_07170 [Jonesia denitrificans]SQH20612.1 Uncharacterised protein [Jonesia denitrificans]